MSAPIHGRPHREDTNWRTICSDRFIRTLPYLLFGISFYLFGHAAYDEERGVAAPPFVPSSYTRLMESREADPAMFRALMNYEWTCPSAFLIGGFVTLGMVRRADRCDPFSKTFSGSSALDECERTLDAELGKKHSPLR